MPRLHARHRTEIRYAGPVAESVNELRLTPSHNGRQSVEWAHLRVEPAAELVGHRDAFGNEVRWFQLADAHRELAVEAEAVVVTRRPAVREPDARGWEAVDEAYADAHAEFLARSTYVHWAGDVSDFADGLVLAEDGSVLEWARSLEAGVNRAIAYSPGSTAVDTSVDEVVRAGRGVCQDMAHLMIAICRRSGVAARYVSGWLHERGRQGPAESHAWVEVAVPGIGWVELDPTHPDPDLEHHVRLAVGRDYADVPPLRGSYLGAPTERMEVTVEVRELPG